MHNGTLVVSTASPVIQTITNAATVVRGITSTSITAFVGVLVWLYNLLVINPLWIFYFVGMYGNRDPAEVCYEKTGRFSCLSPAYWVETQEHMETCEKILKQDFTSWSALLCTIVYFTLLTYVVIQLIFNCCYGTLPKRTRLAPNTLPTK